MSTAVTELEIPQEIENLLWDEVPQASEYSDPVSLHNTLVLGAFIRGQLKAIREPNETIFKKNNVKEC